MTLPVTEGVGVVVVVVELELDPPPHELSASRNTRAKPEAARRNRRGDWRSVNASKRRNAARPASSHGILFTACGQTRDVALLLRVMLIGLFAVTEVVDSEHVVSVKAADTLQPRVTVPV